MTLTDYHNNNNQWQSPLINNNGNWGSISMPQQSQQIIPNNDSDDHILNISLNALQEQHQKLSSQITGYQQRVQQLEQVIHQQQTELIRQRQEHVIQLKEIESAHEAEMDEVQRVQFETLATLDSRWKSRISLIEGESERLEEELQVAKERMKAMEQREQARGEEVKSLKNQLAALTVSYEQGQKEINRQSIQIESLTNQNVDLEKKLDQTCSDNNSLLDKVRASMRSELEKKESELISLTSKYDQRGDKIKQLEGDYRELFEEYQNYELDVESNQKKYLDFIKQLKEDFITKKKDLQSKIKAQEEKIRELTCRSRQQQMDIELLRERDKKEHVETLDQVVEDAQKARLSLLSELEACKNQIRELGNELALVRAREKEAEQREKQERSRIQELERRIWQLEEEKQALFRQLQFPNHPPEKIEIQVDTDAVNEQDDFDDELDDDDSIDNVDKQSRVEDQELAAIVDRDFFAIEPQIKPQGNNHQKCKEKISKLTLIIKQMTQEMQHMASLQNEPSKRSSGMGGVESISASVDWLRKDLEKLETIIIQLGDEASDNNKQEIYDDDNNRSFHKSHLLKRLSSLVTGYQGALINALEEVERNASITFEASEKHWQEVVEALYEDLEVLTGERDKLLERLNTVSSKGTTINKSNVKTMRLTAECGVQTTLFPSFSPSFSSTGNSELNSSERKPSKQSERMTSSQKKVLKSLSNPTSLPIQSKSNPFIQPSKYSSETALEAQS